MQRNFIKKCKVCGVKENVLFHYGVCSCRACGSFFRIIQSSSLWCLSSKFVVLFRICLNLRIGDMTEFFQKFLFKRRYLENENEWKYNLCKCLNKNREEKFQPDLAKCKKCRLQKCLSAGMKKLGLLK
uniref:Nuclear receptor domain-containing protein n=1 Tax=Meloidogyne incognita TaxID=6306 RepID=A0A914KKS6_MELIC